MVTRYLPLLLLLALTACSSGSTDFLGSVGAPASDDTAASGDLSIDPSGDLSEDSAESDSADSSTTDDSEPAPEGEPDQPIQSGLLTAADYDDQLNPEQYQAYARNALQSFEADAQAPTLNLDAQQRVQIRVVDNDNNPHAGAHLQVINQQDNTLALRTASDGTAWLYPGMDNLADSLQIAVQNQSGDVQLQQTVDLTQLSDDRVISFTLPATATPSTALDLALVIDTTGSMGDELNYLQAELTDIINALAQSNPTVSIRVALIVYRDEGDEYVVRTHAFTSSITEAQRAIDGESFAGGGDYPEAMDQALQAMLTLDWRDDATRVALLVADAPPHTQDLHTAWDAALTARSELIHIVPLAASGVAEVAEYMMRSMAALTQGRYLFLTDDSGIGNPHEEPTIDCYLVTRLDSLIRRVVESLIIGERVEPESSEVLRRVGDYDQGVCGDSEQ